MIQSHKKIQKLVSFLRKDKKNLLNRFYAYNIEYLMPQSLGFSVILYEFLV